MVTERCRVSRPGADGRPAGPGGHLHLRGGGVEEVTSATEDLNMQVLEMVSLVTDG